MSELFTRVGVREVQAYIESCTPDDALASPYNSHYCLGAQTLRTEGTQV